MAIRILDQGTVNKIAAGEVIERPASALKELLENSADSGATRVEVDFASGGKAEIRVTDDGSGIHPDELYLALAPHATSKIQTIDDLDRLSTFGFRGEALASMAAVSRMALHSSQKGSDAGARIFVEGGIAGRTEPAAPINGTQVVIKDLFFNVPARQKFLKSDAGETAAVKKVVKAFALSHPEIAVTLRQNQKGIYHWPKESFASRACRVLELEPSQTVHAQAESAGMALDALLVLPEFNISTQQGMWVLVQGRPVQDRTIVQAIIEGYRNLVMQHQYPQAVLSLRVDPSQVDVNVHPTKAQVKFLNPSVVFRFISGTIKQKFAEKFEEKVKGGGGLELESGPAQYVEPAPTVQESLIREAVTQYNRRDLGGGTKKSQGSWSGGQARGAAARSSQHPAFTNPEPEAATDAASASASASVRKSASASVQKSESESEIGSVSESGGRIQKSALGERSSGIWSSLQVIGQFANTYIITQSPKALLLVDQHAAHERVLFERIKRQFENGSIEKQTALLEELVELPRENIEALTDPKITEIFEKMGFEYADRGPSTLAIYTRPAFLLDVSLKSLLERVSEQVMDVGDSNVLNDLVTDLWASMACHGAIRAGRTLSHSEMEALLVQMDEFSFSSFCPHGRPVSVQWNLHELEKMFKRIV